MYTGIEPSGCAVRKGKVQIRFSFYLEPGDARYDEHHVQVPIIPPEGYPGEVDELGSPKDLGAYNTWLESLSKEWQNNPFHNHFVYVDPDVTDEEIRKLMRDHLQEFYGIWGKGQDVLSVWKSKGRLVLGDMSSENISRCEGKVLDIRNRASAFEHKGIV